MITDEARRIAALRAAQDRDLLARLLRERRVGRDPEIGKNVPGRAAFMADIEARAGLRPAVNTAIRPKKRRRR